MVNLLNYSYLLSSFFVFYSFQSFSHFILAHFFFFLLIDSVPFTLSYPHSSHILMVLSYLLKMLGLLSCLPHLDADNSSKLKQAIGY